MSSLSEFQRAVLEQGEPAMGTVDQQAMGVVKIKGNVTKNPTWGLSTGSHLKFETKLFKDQDKNSEKI